MDTDCHVHAVLDGIDFKASIAAHRTEAGPDEARIRSMLSAYQRRGVTYLRDGGDRWGACLTARRLAPEYGIEYAAPLAPLYKKGNYGKFIGRGYADLREFAALVDEMKAAGADFIKVMLSGIMDFDHYGVVTGFTLEKSLVRDLIAVAHDRGLPVMGHVNGARAIQDAVEAGIDSVEHGYYSDEESRAALAESDTVWVPTLSPILNLVGTGIASDEVLERIGAAQFEAIAWVAEHGGRVALGDDAGAHAVRHGQGAADELGYLRNALGRRADEVIDRGNAALRSVFRPRVRSLEAPCPAAEPHCLRDDG